MKRILATGTFDILHPGHIYYLKKSKSYGDELHVIISRDNNIKHKPKPIINEMQRMEMISELKFVDYVHLGDLRDYFNPVIKINPDIITIGFDQKFDIVELKKKLNLLKLTPQIIRIEQKKDNLNLYSSHSIIQKIIYERVIKNNN